jgi:hypothetical protein
MEQVSDVTPASASHIADRVFSAAVKSTQKTVSVLKSDTVSVLKTDACLDGFFAPASKNIAADPTVQLNTDDLNRIAENTVR